MLSWLLFATLVALSHGGTTEPRVVKGEDAKEGEFPFMVSVQRGSDNPRHVCGGVILTKDWILTAAGCCSEKWSTPDIYRVSSGSIHRAQSKVHNVSKVIKHERSENRFAWFDICVLRVAQPLTFDKNTQQAHLQNQNWTAQPEDKFTFIGWGYTSKIPKIAETLQKLSDLTPMSSEECETITWSKMYPGFLCVLTMSREQGICNYDDGGPLIKDGAVVAIYSTRLSSPCRNRFPYKMTLVPFFIDWIRDKLGPDAADLKFIE